MALVGCTRVPSDKSISHRAVLFSALAHGTSRLADVLPSDDVLASIAAVRSLGARVELEAGEGGLSGTIAGFGGECTAGPHKLDCANSGTTTRLLMGLCAGVGAQATLVGDASLSRRPMGRVMEPLELMGARFSSAGGCLPVSVLARDGALHAIDYRTKQASAQVKSAILLAGLFAEGTTRVTEPAASRDHTERLLPAYGVSVERDGLSVRVAGGQQLHAHDLSVPGDPSSAAFVAVAAALCPGSDVTVRHVALNPTRDGALVALRDMGCALAYENVHDEGAEPVGDVHVAYTPHLSGIRIAPERIPTLIDELPVLSLAAAAACGETVFCGAGELRVKESDRFAAILAGLASLGVTAFADGDDLHIVGCDGMPPVCADELAFETHHDHRLAMTWHIAGLAFGFAPTLDDAACVSVSWPGFFADMAALAA